MGAVHGVYLKYVGLSALSYAGYTMLMDSEERSAVLSQGTKLLSSASSTGLSIPVWRVASAAVLGYSALVNGTIAVLFKLEKGMGLIGKNPKTGQIPIWSYVLYFPFHLPTIIYTHVHTKSGRAKVKTETGEIKRLPVPVASEVQPGWWVGGCYGHTLDRDWGGIIDLTVEFPERCIDRCQSYLSVPTWDGVPANPDQLEIAASFAVEAKKKGDVMVHCAHGRGRSTTVMCACLVKAGLFPNWKEAFEKGIKPGRSVCKLNSLMKKSLTAWQTKYVDGKKGQ